MRECQHCRGICRDSEKLGQGNDGHHALYRPLTPPKSRLDGHHVSLALPHLGAPGGTSSFFCLLFIYHPKHPSLPLIMNNPSSTLWSPTSYEDTIDGIKITWRSPGFQLPDDALGAYKGPIELKTLTENVSVAWRKRLGKTSILVMCVMP